MSSDEPSFPRHTARTQRFTLGLPRSFVVAPDGSRVAFLRSRAGSDRVTMLWVLDLRGGDQPAGDQPAGDQPAGGPLAERVVADPRALFEGTEELSPAERARRERSREGAGGIVGFATDKAVTTAAFALSGGLYVADLGGPGGDGAGGVRALEVPGPVVDPRPDPTGRWVAYVRAGALRVVGTDGAGDRELPGQLAETDVSWGLAEFVAAEEMGRSRGYWWAPDGSALLVARVDNGPVQRWHLADPAQPSKPPVELAYPAAGTPNAFVGLHLFGLDGSRLEVSWDAEAYPYLASVHWSADGPPLLHVQSRDQRATRVLSVDVTNGGTDLVHADDDPVWVELVDGVPAWAPGGRLVRVADADGARRLYVGATMASADLQVRGVAAVDAEVLFTASSDSPTEVHLYRTSPDGPVRLSQEPGVHGGVGAGAVTVLVSSSLDWFGRRVQVLRPGADPSIVANHADTPRVLPAPRLLRAGHREVRTALLLPTGHEPGSGPLPVLMDPYGGPHAQRVLQARNGFLEPQWWADQGFAVVVADGRGTPGRGPAWERAIAGDLATPVLEDQVEALHAAAAECADLDLTRVAIRGWSFGGYLAALAVLRRPDVFHAAVAGAPVTDWALYDTHYTERYLGTPQLAPEAYAVSSVLGDAAKLERPLLLVHGLADDNVVAAHTLQLSAALLAAGRPHQVLPLSGVTHMTPQEIVAENLLLFQLDFLRSALDL